MRRAFVNELRFRDGIKIGDSREIYERASKIGKIEYYGEPTWIYRRHPEAMTINVQ